MPIEKRIFIPGSRWVYFKFYTGVKSADEILTQVVLRMTERLEKADVITKWFFVRYSDPEFHIRIRLLVNRSESIHEVIKLIFQKFDPLVASGQVWKVQFDTYHRELERYHPNLINLGESIFFEDSKAILRILRQLQIGKNEHFRWMISLNLVDEILSTFGFSINDKERLLVQLSSAFKKEFGFEKPMVFQFNDKYRKNKTLIENCLIGSTTADREYMLLLLIVENYSKNLQSLARDILRKCLRNNIELEPILTSYIHMTLNRLFMSKGRIQEMIVYDFMSRYYVGLIARSKKGNALKKPKR